MRRDHTLLLLTRLKSRAASSRDHFQCMWLLRTYPRVILDLVHFKKRLLSFVHVSIIFIKAICRAIRHVALAVYCISPVHRFSFQTEWFSDFWCTCASASARQSRAQCRAREFCCKILIADRARY